MLLSKQFNHEFYVKNNTNGLSDFSSISFGSYCVNRCLGLPEAVRRRAQMFLHFRQGKRFQIVRRSGYRNCRHPLAVLNGPLQAGTPCSQTGP